MKKCVMIFCCLLLLAGSAAAKGPKGKDLAGVWQMCIPVYAGDSLKNIQMVPFLKILYDDNRFMDIVITGNSPAKVTAEGKWKADDKGVYVESVAQSTNDPAIVGKDNKMSYKIINDDMFSITYQMPGSSRPATEIWYRVRMHIGARK